MNRVSVNEEHPLITILLTFSRKRDPLEFPNTTLKNWIIPTIDKNYIQEVRAKLKKKEPYPKVLSNIKHFFPFDPNYLFYCIDFLQEGNIKHKNIYLVPLSVVIYWLSCEDLSEIKIHFSPLIQVILYTYGKISQKTYFFSLKSVVEHFLQYGKDPFPQSLIPILFERSQDELIDIACVILDYFKKHSKIESTHFLIDALTSAVSKEPNEYVDYDFTNITKKLLPLLKQYDIPTLGLYSALASVHDNDTLKMAFFDIPSVYMTSLINLPIKTAPLRITRVDSKDHFMFRHEANDENNSEAQKILDFPTELNPPPISAFQVHIDYDDLLREEELYHLKILFSLLSRVLPSYTRAFFEGFLDVVQASESQEYSLELFISFLYSIDRIQSVDITDGIFKEITSNTVFTPGISIFKKCDSFEMIAFLRKSVLLILAKQSPKLVGTLLQNIKEHPFLFADVIGRMHVNLDKFDLEALIDEGTLGAIVHVVSNLSRLAMVSDQETIQKISQARSTLMIFLFSILENATIASQCFSSSVFTDGFLARIFDPSFHKPVILVLRQFLTRSNVEMLDPAIEYICRILDVCSKDDQKDHELVAIDLLSTVNESIVHNRFVPLKFESLITAATKFLAARGSVKFLDQTLQLYSQMLLSSPNYTVSFKQIQQLSIAIRKSDNITPSDTTVCGLVGMMARSRSVTINNAFFVQEPKISILLFSTIQTHEDTMKYINLFWQLCQHSAYNCTQCHMGELDLLLIHMIKNYPKSFIFRDCKFDLVVTKEDIIKSVLPLINQILLYQTSQPVCAGLVSLLSPNKDGVFSEFAPYIIKQLSTIVSRLFQDPPVSLPLGFDNQTFLFEGLRSNDLEYGFTFQFLLFADVHAAIISNRRPMILQISDANTQIQLYIQGSSIVCRINSTSGSSFAALHTGYPSCTWGNITLILQQFKDDSSAISFSLNNSQPATFNLELPQFIDGPLSVQIGGLAEPPTESGEPIEPLCNIGAFRFFNEALEKEDLNQLSELGSRKPDNFQIPLFCYPPPIGGVQGSPSRSITLIKNGKNWPAHDNIIDNLKKAQILRLFVPLFFYFNTMPNRFSELLLDIMLSAVSSKKQFPYFRLIGKILSSASTNLLTYSLYIKFFAIAETINDIPLVKSLVSNVLLNFDIWCHAEGSQFIRIVGHWGQNLYPSCGSIAEKIFILPNLLSYARIYLWYEPIEVDIIKGAPGSKYPRDPNLDIDQCRQLYNRLLLAVGSHNFTPQDARTLVSHCASCPDQQQVSSFLTVFLEIIQRNRLKLNMPMNACRITYNQIKPHQELHFAIAYKVLYSMADIKQIHEYNNEIIEMMNSEFFTDTLFQNCSELISNYPCSYPLNIYIAMNLRKENCLAMAQKLVEININEKMANAFMIDKNWCAWPLALLSRLGDEDNLDHSEEREKVINFLFSISIANQDDLEPVDTVLNTFDLFASIFNNTFEDCSRIYMVKIARHYNNSENRTLSLGIILRCIKMLTTYITDQPNSALKTLFSNSPFNDSNNNSTNTKNSEMKSLKDIINEIISLGKLDNNLYKFGIILGVDEQPLFSELYSLTELYLSKIDSLNPAVIFWHQTYELMLEHSPIDLEKFENIFLKCSSYSSKITFLNKKRGIFILDSIRKAILKSEQSLSLKVLHSDELSIASENISSVQKYWQIKNHRFNKSLKDLIRLSMQEDSPWNDSRFRMVGIKKSFRSDSEYSQPFVKRIYNSPLIDVEPIELPEQSINAFKCHRIKFTKEIPCYFEFFDSFIKITTSITVKKFSFDDIKRIFIRERFHMKNSLEFYLKNGKSRLFDFSPINAQEILTHFPSINPQLVQTVSPDMFFASTSFTKTWTQGYLSNYEYLMILNYFAGRTFNDPTLYPIFPWVLSSFNKDFSEITFRDLKKPIAAQNKSQKQVYLLAPSCPTLLSYFLYKLEPFKSIPKNMKIQLLRPTKEPFKNFQNAYDFVTSKKINFCWELTPEFYFMPLVFSNNEFQSRVIKQENNNTNTSHFMNTTNIEYPEWASNEFEFIYLHRKALEHPEVSQNLNHWIDLLFGYASIKGEAVREQNVFNPVLFSSSSGFSDNESLVSTLQKIGHMPSLLFKKPHPKKIVLPRKPTFHSPLSISIDLKQEIAFASIYETSYSEIKFIAYLKDGSVLNVRTDFVSQINCATSAIGSLSSNCELTPCQLIGFEKGMIYIDDNNSNAYVIQSRSIKKYDINIRHISCMASSGSVTAASSINGEVIGWEDHDFDNELHFCNVSCDYVTSLAISQRYGLIACGTSNAELVVYSYHDELLQFLVRLPTEPSKILFTESLGFIVVESGQELFLISVTGQIIRQTHFDFIIERWTTWSCERGIDFIAILDNKNQLRMSEAFYLNFNEVFYQNKTKIIEMKYIIPTRGIVIISPNGSAKLIPKELPF